MTTLRWLTAGESHGPTLVATLEGLPAGLPLDEAAIAAEMARRRLGFGRGGRMKIEDDRARIVAGVRHGRTLGSPVALLVENKDHANWAARMSVAPPPPGEEAGPAVTLPRPGHADLAAGLKYGVRDLRDVLERASARETAARAALGAVAKVLLAAADVRVGSHVRSIRSATAAAALELWPEARFDASSLNARSDASPVRCADPEASEAMVAQVREAQRLRDTAGGTFEVVVSGLPPGVGSHAQWDRRLDARLVQAVVSVPAVKGAEVGDGFAAAALLGSQVHDAIVREGPALARPTNRAGGTEGGVSNGEPLVVRGAMKPIATLSEPLPSVDLATGAPGRAHVERSDTCAVPAAAVAAEAVVALAVAQALLEAWGADSLDALRAQVRAAWRRSRRLGGHVYLCGASGAGKSTTGPLVARALGLPFADLDAEVERAEGASVRELFARGEAAFRDAEARVLDHVSAGPRAVIALGGGAVASARVRDRVRRSGDLVELRAPAAVLAARIGADRSRPLLGDEPRPALERLLALRADLHGMACDAVVDAAAPPADVAQRVLGALGALS